MARKENVCIRFPTDMRRDLREAAWEEHMSFGEFVRSACRALLRERRAQKAIRPHAESVVVDDVVDKPENMNDDE